MIERLKEDVIKAEQVASIEVEPLTAKKKNVLCSIVGCISFGPVALLTVGEHSSCFTHEPITNLEGCVFKTIKQLVLPK
jgi:hypothetical protein